MPPTEKTHTAEAKQPFPQLIVRPAEMMRVELGYCVRHEWRKGEPTGSIMSIIADPKGEYWCGIAEISTCLTREEQRAWAAHITEGLSSHAALLARNEELTAANEGLVKACQLVISTLSKDGVPFEACDADMLDQVSAALTRAASVEVGK